MHNYWAKYKAKYRDKMFSETKMRTIASYFPSTVVREKPQIEVPIFRFDLSISFHLVGFVKSIKHITNTRGALPRLLSSKTVNVSGH